MPARTSPIAWSTSSSARSRWPPLFEFAAWSSERADWRWSSAACMCGCPPVAHPAVYPITTMRMARRVKMLRNFIRLLLPLSTLRFPGRGFSHLEHPPQCALGGNAHILGDFDLVFHVAE